MENPFENLELIDVAETVNVNLDDLPNLKILIICDEQEYQQHKDLLNNILKSINVENDHNGKIIPLKPSESINLAQIYKRNTFEIVLIFFISTKRLGLNIVPFKNKWIETESFKLLFTNNLDAINSNKALKKELWNCLKSMNK